MRVSNLVVASTAIVTLLAGSATAAQAQGGFRWPDHPKNIKALPDDIGGERLSAVMRGFTAALGVRCEYCHVDNGARSLADFDFASDDKPTKAKARLMIRMVHDINGTQLAGLADLGVPDAERVRVTCVTCHRGLSRPVMLEDVLARTIDSAGVDSAIAQYQALRKRYYGGFSYDFSPGVLTRLGEELSRAGKYPAAIAMIQLEITTNGEDVRTLAALGGAQAASGDKEAALATFQKALDQAPDRAKPMIQRQIDRLKTP